MAQGSGAVSHMDRHHAHHFKNGNEEFEACKQGMWIFLVTEVLATFPYREQIGGAAWPLLPIMCLLPALGAGICLVVVNFVRPTRPRAD